MEAVERGGLIEDDGVRGVEVLWFVFVVDAPRAEGDCAEAPGDGGGRDSCYAELGGVPRSFGKNQKS